MPSFTEPYRKGWQLALDEINAAGGVDGKKLEVISKDDGGKPADAVTAANELVANDGVVMLAGTFFSNIGLAVSDYAKQKKILFLAAEPLTDAITLSKGNRYTFRLRPGNYEQAAMLAEEAAKLPAKKWATIAPNYEYGQSAVAVFKKLLSAKRPDIEWVGEQWPPQGKIDAGAVVEAIAKTEPDAILNVTFGPDLVKLVREGNTRGLFKDRSVVSFLTGEPEYLDPLKDETPEGWIVTGYPWADVTIPDHAAFLKAYQAKYNDYPRLGSVVGYSDDQGRRGDPRQGAIDRQREAGRRRRGHRGRDAVRPDHVPRHRSPVDARRFRRQDRAEGRQGRDGRRQLSRRRQISALRSRGEGAAPAELIARREAASPPARRLQRRSAN